MILRFYSKIDWKTAMIFLVAACLLFAFTIPYKKKKDAWDFYRQMVRNYEMIKGIEMSELEADLTSVVEVKNDCYAGFSELPPRLSICRKQYLSDILALVRENVKSSPSLGKFILCIRDCPLAYSMCRGEVPDGTDADSECTIKELQCIESCLDLYWRGTE